MHVCIQMLCVYSFVISIIAQNTGDFKPFFKNKGKNSHYRLAWLFCVDLPFELHIFYK